MTQRMNPDGSFVGRDKLIYANAAQYLHGCPAENFRNRNIQRLRRDGRSEAFIDQWIKGYDGDEAPTVADPDPELSDAIYRLTYAYVGTGLTV